MVESANRDGTRSTRHDTPASLVTINTFAPRAHPSASQASSEAQETPYR